MLAVTEPAAADNVVEAVRQEYGALIGGTPWTHVVESADAAKEIHPEVSNDEQSHGRKNLLTGEWILVSPQRIDRPWQGQRDAAKRAALPAHDANCFLCPGNARINGDVNPDYSGPFVFANDFPALSRDAGIFEKKNVLFEARAEQGECRVICYTEQHDQRLSTMSPGEAEIAVRALFDEFANLDARPDINYVQVFENRGEMMGCSNPHPHAQVWGDRAGPDGNRQGARRTTAVVCKERIAAAARLLQCRAKERGAARLQQRTLRRAGALLGDLAVSRPWSFPGGPYRRRRTWTPAKSNLSHRSWSRCLAPPTASSTRRAPYSMGFHPRPSGRPGVPRVDIPRAHLPAAAAFGNGAQAYGRVSRCSACRSVTLLLNRRRDRLRAMLE